VGDRNQKGIIKGDLEAKYADAENGVTFTQTWTTANVLKSNLELEGNLAKGLKIDISGILHPEKHSHSLALTTYYKQPGLNTRAFIDLFHVRVCFYSTFTTPL
jgi:voltage-dependent anion channel protein 2